jgi:hypothetical protein
MIMALLGSKRNTDGFELKLRGLLHAHLKPLALRAVAIAFEKFPDGTVCRVEVAPTAQVVYMNEKDVYVRDGNRTRKSMDLNWQTGSQSERDVGAGGLF